MEVFGENIGRTIFLMCLMLVLFCSVELILVMSQMGEQKKKSLSRRISPYYRAQGIIQYPT